MNINNKVYYFDTDSDSRERKESYTARNELLRTFGVEIIYLNGSTYDAKYKNAVSRIRLDLESITTTT